MFRWAFALRKFSNMNLLERFNWVFTRKRNLEKQDGGDRRLHRIISALHGVYPVKVKKPIHFLTLLIFNSWI
jgi:hypothetical protein